MDQNVGDAFPRQLVTTGRALLTITIRVLVTYDHGSMRAAQTPPARFGNARRPHDSLSENYNHWRPGGSGPGLGPSRQLRSISRSTVLET